MTPNAASSKQEQRGQGPPIRALMQPGQGPPLFERQVDAASLRRRYSAIEMRNYCGLEAIGEYVKGPHVGQREAGQLAGSWDRACHVAVDRRGLGALIGHPER